MGVSSSTTLTIRNKKDFSRVYEIVKPIDEEGCVSELEYDEALEYAMNLPKEDCCIWMAPHCKELCVDFSFDEDKGKLSWGGRATAPVFEIAESVVAHFPDIEFRVFNYIEGIPPKYGYSENGTIKWLKLSDDVNEMLDWGIDVDPYEGPTEEHYEQLRQYRRKRIQEMIDLGVNISPDTWPPLPEHYDEERRLTMPKPKGGDDRDDIEFYMALGCDEAEAIEEVAKAKARLKAKVDDDIDLPF